MATIHYFQRYSQKENVATNNTLLLLSRLYHYSPLLFTDFINELLEDKDVDPGISFFQQTKLLKSVPDGGISQSSFKIVIETKRHEHFSMEQLKNHLNAFQDERKKILLLLGTGIPPKTFLDQLEDIINKSDKKDVRCIALTFETIIVKFKVIIPIFATEMQDVIDDYEDYCREDKLIDIGASLLRVMYCGWTIQENEEFGIYYEKTEKGFSEHKYLGFYFNKSVRGIGIVENIITTNINTDGTLNLVGKHHVTESQIKRVKGIIEASKKNKNWDISRGNRFFCVDKYHPTNFPKKSTSVFRKSKFFNLLLVLGVKKLPSIENIAEELKKKDW